MKKIYPLILDACCGSKMFWFDKNNKNVLFIDKRHEILIAKDKSSKGGRRIINVCPDVMCDFTKLPFPAKSFYLVVFDPPHLKSPGKTSWMGKKYGTLTNDWQTEIKKGFSECFRVLKNNGVLIFKWSEHDIPLKSILVLTPNKPLFGHLSGKTQKTHWICFMKLKGKTI